MPRRKKTGNKKKVPRPKGKSPKNKIKVKKNRKNYSRGSQKIKGKDNVTYRADTSFKLFSELRSLIIKTSSESFPELEKKLKRLGRMKLIVVGGIFINILDARVDLLLVGDNVHLRRLTKVMKDLEVDLGKEIRYVVLSTAEFNYRYEMYDRFLRDILDSPHEKIVNKVKV